MSILPFLKTSAFDKVAIQTTPRAMLRFGSQNRQLISNTSILEAKPRCADRSVPRNRAKKLVYKFA
jgi:hypothetical protein